MESPMPTLDGPIITPPHLRYAKRCVDITDRSRETYFNRTGKAISVDKWAATPYKYDAKNDD